MKKEDYYKVGIIVVLVVFIFIVLFSCFSNTECDMTAITEKVSGISESIDVVGTQVEENRRAIDALSDSIGNLEITPPSVMDNDSMQAKDSELFISRAEDKDETLRDMFYLAAISHDSQNPLYYSQYLEYILEEGNVESLSMLGMLLESAIATSTPENINNLIAVYIDLQNVFIEEESSLFGDSGRENWDESCNNFYACSNSSFSYEEFLAYSDSVVMAYSNLADKTPADDRLFAEIMNIVSLIEKYNNVKSLNNSLNNSTDSQFMEQYVYVASVFDESALSYALRNKENEGNYSVILDLYNQSLNEIISLNVNRYADIRTKELSGSVSALAKRLEAVSLYMADSLLPDCIKEYTSLNNEFTMQSGEFRSVDVVQDRLATIGADLAEIFSEIYQLKYSQYQQWAAEKIYTIKERLDATKDVGMKLTVLASNGYWDMDRTLLIPQLQTALDSLWEEKYEDKSVKSLDILLDRYPIEKRGIM